MRAGGLADLAMCERATAVVFENLRKRLTHAEAEQVCAQLPVALKAVWERGESATRPPLKLDRAEFYARVRREANLASEAEARWVTLSVFAALKEQLTTGESADVMAQLPNDLKEVWAEAQAAA
jgi:uncharacterized protein (DUF2267 family)